MHLAVAARINLGHDQHRDLHDSAALTDLNRQRIRGDEPVQALVERAGAERGGLLVKVLRHLRHLRLGKPGDLERLDRSSIRLDGDRALDEDALEVPTGDD